MRMPVTLLLVAAASGCGAGTPGVAVFRSPITQSMRCAVDGTCPEGECMLYRLGEESERVCIAPGTQPCDLITCPADSACGVMLSLPVQVACVWTQ